MCEPETLNYFSKSHLSLNELCVLFPNDFTCNGSYVNGDDLDLKRLSSLRLLLSDFCMNESPLMSKLGAMDETAFWLKILSKPKERRLQDQKRRFLKSVYDQVQNQARHVDVGTTFGEEELSFGHVKFESLNSCDPSDGDEEFDDFRPGIVSVCTVVETQSSPTDDESCKSTLGDKSEVGPAGNDEVQLPTLRCSEPLSYQHKMETESSYGTKLFDKNATESVIDSLCSNGNRNLPKPFQSDVNVGEGMLTIVTDQGTRISERITVTTGEETVDNVPLVKVSLTEIDDPNSSDDETTSATREFFSRKSNQNLFNCYFCQYSTDSPVDINKHIKITHVDNSKYTCKICPNFGAKRRTKWGSHMIEMHDVCTHIMDKFSPKYPLNCFKEDNCYRYVGLMISRSKTLDLCDKCVMIISTRKRKRRATARKSTKSRKSAPHSMPGGIKGSRESDTNETTDSSEKSDDDEGTDYGSESEETKDVADGVDQHDSEYVADESSSSSLSDDSSDDDDEEYQPPEKRTLYSKKLGELRPKPVTSYPINIILNPANLAVNPDIPSGKPATTIFTPAATIMKPDTTSMKPITTYIKSATTNIKPANTIINPVTTNIKPVTTNIKPATSNIKPVTTNIKPVTTNIKPATTNIKSVTTNIKPATTNIKPVTTSIKPATSIIKPDVITVKPAPPRVGAAGLVAPVLAVSTTKPMQQRDIITVTMAAGAVTMSPQDTRPSVVLSKADTHPPRIITICKSPKNTPIPITPAQSSISPTVTQSISSNQIRYLIPPPVRGNNQVDLATLRQKQTPRGQENDLVLIRLPDGSLGRYGHVVRPPIVTEKTTPTFPKPASKPVILTPTPVDTKPLIINPIVKTSGSVVNSASQPVTVSSCQEIKPKLITPPVIWIKSDNLTSTAQQLPLAPPGGYQIIPHNSQLLQPQNVDSTSSAGNALRTIVSVVRTNP